jgi:hypothetical protein
MARKRIHRRPQHQLLQQERPFTRHKSPRIVSDALALRAANGAQIGVCVYALHHRREIVG